MFGQTTTFPLVLRLRQVWHVHQFLFWGMLFWAFFSGFLLGVLCIWRALVLLVSRCVRDCGSSGVPPAGHALWAEVGGGITFATSRENTSKFVKLPACILGDLCGFYDLGATYASLSGTAKSPWL